MIGHGVASCPRCGTQMEFFWENRQGEHYTCRECRRNSVSSRKARLTFKYLADIGLPRPVREINGFEAEV